MTDTFPIEPELLSRITHYLRLANKERAVECVVAAVVGSLVPYIGDGKEWVSSSPISRRADLYSVMRVAAKKMEALADQLMADAKRIQHTTPG